jgi:hypothetical protein
MALEVIPRKITVLPEDRQEFTAVGAPGPALWHNVVNGVVQPNLSVSLSNPALQGEAQSAQWLMCTPGYFEWILTADCLPAGTHPSGGWLEVVVMYGSDIYGVLLYGNKRAVGTGPFTIPSGNFTSQGGDRYRMMIDGQKHLYFNGQLIHETQPPFGIGPPTACPVWIRVRLQPPVVSGAPKLPVIALAGDWQLKDAANIWTAPADGQITNTTGAKTVFFNGDTPGEWPLRAQVGGSANQQFDAVISIPPLAVVGSPAVTLQPGQKTRFKTNYDNARNDIVVWSVVSGGGSFDAGHNFLAPDAPGSSVVRAAYGAQQVNITTTVPPVITPNYIAVEPGELVDWDTNIPSATWTASAGTINPITGFWTAPATTGQVARVTATNGAHTVFRDVVALEKFPLTDPSLPLSWERKKTVLISRAEDRSRAARVKDKDGLAFEAYELQFKNRTLAEMLSVRDFWDRHYPSKRFIFEDRLRELRKVAYFDSDIKHEGNTRSGIDLAFRIVEG